MGQTALHDVRHLDAVTGGARISRSAAFRIAATEFLIRHQRDPAMWSSRRKRAATARPDSRQIAAGVPAAIHAEMQAWAAECGAQVSAAYRVAISDFVTRYTDEYPHTLAAIAEYV